MISNVEFKKEERHLSDIQNITRELIAEKNKIIKERKKKTIEGKKHLWQNKNEYNGPEMYNKMDEEDLNVTLINQDIDKVSKLERSLYSSYFGKVVFRESDFVQDVYVGLTGISKDFKNYVYDWRAPISNLYYNFELGPAYIEVDSKKVDGNIDLKRQFKIEMGKLVNAFDTDVTLEDEILQEVLASSSDDKMKNIVSTIQKEQNEIIRYKANKNLIIEGVAGSGKTSVALHRIAYLLYNEANLTNKNVLIFSPNDIFTNYISNVLPELGEENVDAITMEKLLTLFIKDVKCIDNNTFIENLYKNKKDISAKYSLEYMTKIEAYVKNLEKSLVFTKKIGLKKKFIESSELNKMFTSLEKLSLSDKIYYMADKLCDIYDIDIDKNTTRFVDILKNMLGLDKPVLEFYRDFLNDPDYASDGVISREDVGGLLYMYFLINGFPRLSYIKHIIVDEAQDYSILEFKLLKKIFSSAVFTILGDKNQSVNPYLKYKSLEEINDVFNGVYLRLDKTYRSSKEIIDFTNKILGIDNIKSIRKPMNREVISRSGELLNSDIDLLRKDFKRIAIITKNNFEAKELYKKLDSKYVSLMSDSILKSVVIGPVYVAKGLEFDAVIVYTDVNDKYEDSEKNLYYIAATRAEHALIVYNQ